MSVTWTVTGTISDAQTVRLNQPLPVSSGEVQVTIEMTEPAEKPTWLQVLEQIWVDQKARGHVPMTREEIDAFMREERAGWDHRL